MTEAKPAISKDLSATENLETAPLSEREEKFRLVLEASPDGFIILRSVRDAAGEIVDFQIEYTNPVAATGVNQTPEELLGQYLLQLFPDSQTSGIFARYVAVAKTGISKTFETFYESKDLTGWFRNVVVKLNDGIVVSFSDITARKQAELALQQFEESLKAANQRISNILESITDAFVAFDRDWRYTYVNQEAARMLRRSPQELLGQRWTEVFPETAPQNAVIAQQLQRAMTEQTTVRFEAFSFLVNRWLEISLFPAPDGLAMYFRDISSRKQVEQRRDIQYNITQILAQAKTLAEATPAILQALCENLGWQVGALWQIDAHSHILRCFNYWQTANLDMQAFVEATQQMEFAQGIGLPGRVWSSCQPHWISEIGKDSNFPRTAIASGVGLQSGFGFPILLGDEILGVIECFSGRIQEPDADLLEMMQAIGSQIGQFMERKRTEAALQESQELFQSFMNHSPIAAFIKDESGRYLYVNAWVEQVFGRSDFIGKTDFELLPPATAQQCYTNDMTVLTSGQPMQILETVQQADGEHSYMSFKFPFRNAAGQKLLAGVSLDVTEQQAALRDRLQAEEELRQKEAELRLLTNAVPVLISFVDAEQRYRFNNQKYEEWFGSPASEVYGKYLWEVLGEAAYATIRPYVERVLAGEEVTYESRIPYKNGGTRFISATYVPRIDQQGKLEGFVALVSDITQRQQAEETIRQNEARLRIAQKAANAGIWDWDIVSNQVTWSDEYYRLYGLEKASIEPSYQNWLLSVVEKDRSHVDQAARNALVHRTDFNVEFRIFHPKKGERWLNAIGQTFYDDNGQPQRMTGIALDITKRKQAELALAKSNQTLQGIIQACPLAIMGLQADGTVKIWNPAAERIFGWSEQEVLGQFLPAIPQNKRDEFLNNIATTMQGQVLAGVETQRQKKGNLLIDVAIWSAPIDEAQADISCLSIVADISERQAALRERKQAEAALRQSEAFNWQILESSEDCIKVLDLEGRLLYMSHGGQKLLGADDITPFIGHSWVKFWQETDQPAAQEALKNAITIGVGTFQGYCPTLAGEPKWWDVKVTPIRGADGQIERFLCISRDVTARKQAEEALCQSEERYRYLAELIPQLVWTANPAGVLIDINQRWSDFTGLTLEDAQIDGWQAVVHPDDLQILSQKWAIAQQDGTYYQAEGRMRRADGVYRWHLHQAVPLRNEHGRVIKWFGTATDIEDQKQLEQQRIRLLHQEQAAREQAEAANRIKDEFLAVLSHELRSPLNPILGWSRLLQKAKLDEARTKQALATIERNAKLQAELIEDLLDVSRILQGKLSLTSSPVNLASIITAAIETVRLAAEAKSMQIEANLDGEISLVLGDSTRLQQVMWNLLSNAVKFTPPGGRVEVRLFQIGNQAQIMVSDTGKGISPDFLPYVFDYFRQADSTTTRKFGGLGLGLAIVRHLVELHGGTIQAESPGEGLGATFTLKLPLMPTQSAVNQDAPSSEPSLSLHGLEILVVDDDTDTREFVAFLLEQAGARVITAASAMEALEVLTQSQPDVILSDIGMPQVNGYMLIQQIRALPPEQGGQIPAIALTAYAGEIDEKQALKVGFQKHISKPADPDNLVRTIVNLINMK